jgi:membrane associated rhomboid family serine protease
MNWHERISETSGRNFERLKESRVVWLLAGVLLLIHWVTVMIAGWNRWDAGPWEMWGLSRDFFLSGRWWQILTHAVIHGSWFHLVLNGLFLLAVGSRIEHIAGGRILGVTVLAGIVLGGISHLAMGHGILVGFSGAAFALWMLLIGLSPESRMLPFPGPCLWLGWGTMVASLVLAMCDPQGGFGPFRELGDRFAMRFGSWIFEIGHACHLGGGAAGWLMGLWILRPRIKLETLQKKRAHRENRHARNE